jgi:hypothetical protein
VHTTERLQAVVLLMHSSTAELTRRFLHPPAPLPDHDDLNPLTRSNLARILLHRAAADPAAKAFVAGHRAWLGRVLARNSARDESVRERCFGGNRQHPLASPTGGWEAQPERSFGGKKQLIESPHGDAGRRSPATPTPPSTCPAPASPPPRSTCPARSPAEPRSASAELLDSSESDDPFDTPRAARLLATPPRRCTADTGEGGGHGAGEYASAQGEQGPGGNSFPGSQVITQSF